MDLNWIEYLDDQDELQKFMEDTMKQSEEKQIQTVSSLTLLTIIEYTFLT